MWKKGTYNLLYKGVQISVALSVKDENRRLVHGCGEVFRSILVLSGRLLQGEGWFGQGVGASTSHHTDLMLPSSWTEGERGVGVDAWGGGEGGRPLSWEKLFL